MCWINSLRFPTTSALKTLQTFVTDFERSYPNEEVVIDIRGFQEDRNQRYSQHSDTFAKEVRKKLLWFLLHQTFHSQFSSYSCPTPRRAPKRQTTPPPTSSIPKFSAWIRVRDRCIWLKAAHPKLLICSRSSQTARRNGYSPWCAWGVSTRGAIGWPRTWRLASKPGAPPKTWTSGTANYSRANGSPCCSYPAWSILRKREAYRRRIVPRETGAQISWDWCISTRPKGDSSFPQTWAVSVLSSVLVKSRQDLDMKQ